MGPPRSICRLCASSARQLSRASHRAPAQARWSSSQTVSKLVFSDDDGAEPSAVRHIHISSDPTSGTFPSYTAASEFQDSLRHAFLEWKSAPTARAPSPLVISFTPAPTYTLGRRQKLLTGEQSDRLRRPLTITLDAAGNTRTEGEREYIPEVIETDRGGLTTYHGPGQIVLWPIIDLHSEYYPHQTVRSYARLLEQTTQAVLADGPGLGTYLSEEDPGVWAESARSRPGGQERKLAAMGVHLRRHISGLGTALNVDVVVDGGEKTNPWARFVPCGLEGKTATSVQTEVGAGTWEAWRAAGDERAGREWYARRWVDEFAKRLGVQPANGTVLHRLD
ncbi:lipoyl transferase [Colletotrichum truncatum]|uniref:Lipoyl transferase n=1 Tax=Colletotrichum truncatum TaxID=5467 RepID=A0ACC3YYU7_COLTU|nr:lipoyl transferase [Colletotrichum truncatum]KAF6781729.1 lipoyl transferase [Colletotrichum truncatum]